MSLFFLVPSKNKMRPFQTFLFICTFSLISFSIAAQKNYSEIYNSDTFLEKGLKLYEEGKYQESIVEYEKIKKADPSFLKAQYEILLSLGALEKKEEQKALFEKLYQSQQMIEFPELLL